MIAAIVLAAGRSRRMGAQKLLLPLGGVPMIARVVDAVLAGTVDDVVVVIGPGGERIAAALAGRPVRFIANPNPDGEMLGSVRCGLRALPPKCEAALVVLGDQPGLTAGLIATLVGAFRSSGRGIVVPTHCGRRGHRCRRQSEHRFSRYSHCHVRCDSTDRDDRPGGRTS